VTGAVSTIVNKTLNTSSYWEFRVTFASSTTSSFTTPQGAVIHISTISNSGLPYVVVMNYLRASNYPLFYDYKNPRGSMGSGR
jgi:hypothetical protein